MKTRKPLQRKVCTCCERFYFARSALSKFCSTLCQNRSYRANKKTHEQLEAEFILQELENNNTLQHGAA